MGPTDRRIAKLADYTKICLSTLGSAKLTLALLKPLIDNKDLQQKHIAADAFIAHQHLANALLGSFLTEAISISEGKGRDQASLWKIRQAIDSPDIIQELQARWRRAYETIWDDPDNLLDESMMGSLRERDTKSGLEDCHGLIRLIQENYDHLCESSLYRNSKAARDRILAHKDTWRCMETNTWRAEWFDRVGLRFSDAWDLSERLGKVSTDSHLLLTSGSYVLDALDQQAEHIAARFWRL